MAVLLLLAIWSGIIGYALVYHGLASLNGQNLSLGQVLTGKV